MRVKKELKPRMTTDEHSTAEPQPQERGFLKRRGRKGPRRGAQRKFLRVLCENLCALCVKNAGSEKSQDEFLSEMRVPSSLHYRWGGEKEKGRKGAREITLFSFASFFLNFNSRI